MLFFNAFALSSPFSDFDFLHPFAMLSTLAVASLLRNVIKLFKLGSFGKNVITFLLQGLVEASIEPNCANSGATGKSPSGALTASPVSCCKRGGRGDSEARQKTLTTPLSCSEQARYSLSLNTALEDTLSCCSPSPPGDEVPPPSSTCCSPNPSSIRDPSPTLLRPSHSFGIPRYTALKKGSIKQMPLVCLPEESTSVCPVGTCVPTLQCAE